MAFMLTDSNTGNETMFDTLTEALGGARFDRLKEYTIDRFSAEGDIIEQVVAAVETNTQQDGIE